MSGLVDTWTIEFAKLREKKARATMVSSSSSSSYGFANAQAGTVDSSQPRQSPASTITAATTTSGLLGRVMGFHSSDPSEVVLFDLYSEAAISMMIDCFSP